MLVNKKSKQSAIYITILTLVAISIPAIVLHRYVKNKYTTAMKDEFQKYYLVNLSSIPWPNYQRPNISTVAEMEKIDPLGIKTNVGQQRSLEILALKFKEAMKEANLEGQWFLAAGVLLGSLQHHDFIPWDDDADFFLHIKHRRKVQAALKKLGPRFRVFPRKIMDKFYFAPFDPDEKLTPESIGSHYEAEFPWAWPFIDVVYYEIYELNRGRDFGRPRLNYSLLDIFPLQYRPLGKEWFPTPRRPVSYLKSYYGTKKQICKSHFWNHFSEKFARIITKDCRKLMDKYAFVHRCPVPREEFQNPSSGLCDEYLVNGKGEVIHKIRLPLDEDECKSPLYTVHHESFKCP